MDWSKIPDILAVTSLACAFASLLRHNRTPAHRLWLVGWTLIVCHFFVLMFANLPGAAGIAATILALTTLVAAGLCFMWATIPSETEVNSRRMAVVTFLTSSLFIALACLPSVPGWGYDLAALAIGFGPLSVAIFYRKYGQHALRWLTVALQLALGAELLVLRRQSGGDPGLGIDAILFVIFLGCCIYFWYSHKEGTTGSIITIGGFLAWSLVFVAAPLKDYFLPRLLLESEVWNLPKYVVAVGMLLLLLEKQIERSRYLALHDDLTSLANRRLFQDRLNSAIERARRANTSVALLLIDLDGFKTVNDTYGHHMGDMLLRHVSFVLEARFRRSDTVARTGGDEFCVILEEPNRRGSARLIGQTLEATLSEPVQLAGTRITFGASVGVATFPEDAADADSLCIEADMRMYAAKQERKNGHSVRSTDSVETQTVNG